MDHSTPLRRVLESEGRRQSWLAAKVGKDPADMSRIVNGMVPSEPTRAAIADALGRHVDELWPPAADTQAAA